MFYCQWNLYVGWSNILICIVIVFIMNLQVTLCLSFICPLCLLLVLSLAAMNLYLSCFALVQQLKFPCLAFDLHLPCTCPALSKCKAREFLVQNQGRRISSASAFEILLSCICTSLTLFLHIFTLYRDTCYPVGLLGSNFSGSALLGVSDYALTLHVGLSGGITWTDAYHSLGMQQMSTEVRKRLRCNSDCLVSPWNCPQLRGWQYNNQLDWLSVVYALSFIIIWYVIKNT